MMPQNWRHRNLGFAKLVIWTCEIPRDVRPSVFAKPRVNPDKVVSTIFWLLSKHSFFSFLLDVISQSIWSVFPVSLAQFTLQSSIFNAHKSTSYQILYCVLGRSIRIQNLTQHGKKRIEWITFFSQSCRTFDGIDGEPTEFQWNIFPRFDTLQFYGKVNDLLSDFGETSENLKEFYLCQCSTTFHMTRKLFVSWKSAVTTSHCVKFERILKCFSSWNTVEFQQHL